MTTTADTIIELADMALAQAIACSLRVPPQGTWADEADALRTAVEFLVAERDALRAAHESIATLDHTRPLLDARTISRAALRGPP